MSWIDSGGIEIALALNNEQRIVGRAIGSTSNSQRGADGRPMDIFSDFESSTVTPVKVQYPSRERQS